MALLAPSQSSGDDAHEARVLVRVRVLEVVWQVGVEGHGVALAEAVLLPRDVQGHGAVGHDRGLAAAGLVHRRVARAAGRRARLQRVRRYLGPLAGQWRRDDLVGVLARAARAALGLADHAHALALVEPQELREAELEAARDPPRHAQRWARLAAL